MSKLNLILSKVLGVDPHSVNDSMSPENTESWDSFNALMLVSELESGFNVRFTMEEISDVKCVGDIKRHLRSHGVEINEV